MLIQGIRALFLAQSPITTLAPAQTVGGISVPCVFCDAPVQGVVPPFVVIRSESQNPEQTLDGTKTEEIFIDAVSYSAVAARVLNKTVSDYFETFTGAATADTITDTITGVFPQDKTNDYIFPQEGKDTKYYASTREMTVFYV